MIEGYDLSNNNADVPDLGDVGFVFHKVSQGNWFTDGKYAERADWIRGNWVWGAYLFPEITASAASQVAFFANRADIRPGDVVILDFEDLPGGYNAWRQYSNQSIAGFGTQLMNGLIAAYPNNRVLIYCNLSTYWNIVQAFGIPVGDGVWIATPDQTPTMDWVFWQYTSEPVDTNKSKFDTEARLRSWANKGEFLMALTDAQQDELYRRVVDMDDNGAIPYKVNGAGNSTGEVVSRLEGRLDAILAAVSTPHTGDDVELVLVRELVTAVTRLADHFAPKV